MKSFFNKLTGAPPAAAQAPAKPEAKKPATTGAPNKPNAGAAAPAAGAGAAPAGGDKAPKTVSTPPQQVTTIKGTADAGKPNAQPPGSNDGKVKQLTTQTSNSATKPAGAAPGATPAGAAKPAAAGAAGAGAGAGGAKTASSTGTLKKLDAKELEKLAGPKLTKADLLKPIPTFQETPANNRPALFLQKLRLCCVMFDWAEESSPTDNRAKEVKRQQLLELVEFIGKTKNIYNESSLTEIIRMVSTNLFRALPPKQTNENASHADGEEEEPVFEQSWPHLQIVYEFFLRFIVSGDVDIRTLKKHINGTFVQKLLELFDSEDHRERDYLKTILHRIYAKFMSLRAFIRKAINNVFYTFIYETEKHNGIAELLEILGSIINGFALPLKAEHKTFLKKVLTPMHKVRPLNAFHQQLSYCVTQFVDKDPQLAVPVLTGLIRYWPVINSAKEVLFLNELEELLELTQPEEFQTILVPLFKQLSKSIGSPHFQVAERALFLWHNEYISSLIADHRAQVLPVIYPVLHVNSQSHWNPTVNNLTLNVLKIFMELDPALVESCSKKYAEEQARLDARNKIKTETWQRLDIPMLTGATPNTINASATASGQQPPQLPAAAAAGGNGQNTAPPAGAAAAAAGGAPKA